VTRVGIVLALVAITIRIAGERATELLRYERGVEVWRWATGHLVHSGWAHLGMNLFAGTLIWMLFGKRLTWVALVVAAAGVSAGLYAFSPHVEWYVGFSGVLHGVFAFGAARAVRGGRRFWLGGLVALTTKIALEQWRGALPGVEDAAGAAVIVDAHLYGALAGLLAGLVRPSAR